MGHLGPSWAFSMGHFRIIWAPKSKTYPAPFFATLTVAHNNSMRKLFLVIVLFFKNKYDSNHDINMISVLRTLKQP